MTLGLALLALQDEAMDALVERWRSGDVEARSGAAANIVSRWKEWTEADLEKLDAAMADPDSEVAERARDVRSEIRLSRLIGEKVLKEVPGVVAAFLRGGDREKLAALGVARALFEKGRLGSEDLKGLAEVAGAAQWENPQALTKFLSVDRKRVFEIPLDPDDRAQLRARGVERLAAAGAKKAPEVAGFLKDEEPAVRGAALRSLGRMGAREQAPRVVTLLKDPQPGLRWNAVEILGEWGRKEFAPDLVPLLQDRSWTVRWKAAEALAGWGAKEYAREIAPLLKDVSAEARAEAAYALGEFGARDRAEDLAALLTDPHEAPRRNAAFALGKLGAREYAGRITPLLKDEDLWVRMSAVQALGLMGQGEHVSALMALLRDPEPELRSEAAWALGRVASAEMARGLARLLEERDPAVRHAAVETLERLDAREQAGAVAGRLKDESPRVRARAAAALGRLGAAGHAEGLCGLLKKGEDRRARTWSAVGLGELAARAGDPALRGTARGRLLDIEGDEDRIVGLAASIALVRMGEKDKPAQSRALRELAANTVATPYLGGPMLDALARAHEKDACERLDKKVDFPRPVATWIDVAEMLDKAGFKLDAAEAYPLGRLDPRSPATVRGALEFVLGRYVPPEIVPDGDRLRLMPRSAALLHWQKRLDAK